MGFSGLISTMFNTEWSLSIIENTDDAGLMTKFIEDQDCKCGPTGVDYLPLPRISFYILKVTTAHLPGVEPIVPAVKFSLLVESTFSWTSWTADLKLELIHAMGDPGFPRQRGRLPQRRATYFLANFSRKMHENEKLLV